MKLNANSPMLSRLILPALCVGLFLSSCSKSSSSDDQVLAQIEDLKVTEAHLQSAFLKYYYKSGQSLKPSFSTKSNILDMEFNTYVLAVYAEDQGLTLQPEVQNRKEMIRRKVLNEEYMEQVVLDTVEISDPEIREMFVKFNTQLRASHLYAPTKEKAGSLYQRLKAGESFEKLASETFQNRKLAESGGDLGEFSVDEMDVAFENAAFKLKVGEISGPVRTAQGYSIIKLTDKFTKPVLTEYQYASKKDQFAYFAENQQKELVKRNHMYDFISGLSINEEVFRESWNRIASNLSSFSSGNLEYFTGRKDLNIAEYGDFTLDLDTFYREAMLTPVSNLNNIRDEETFKNFLRGIAYRRYMYEKAMEHGLDEKEEVTASIDESYYVYLAGVANQHLEDQLSFTNLELRKAYEEKTERYTKPLEINLSRIIVEDEKTAEEVIKKLKNGAAFPEMVEEYTISNEERLTDGRLGYEYVTKYGFLSPDLSRLQPGEVSEPLKYQTGVYHIYKCLGRKESRQLSFEEAKGQVKQDLLKVKLDEKRKETIEAVKARHGAKVHTEKLRKLTIQI